MKAKTKKYPKPGFLRIIKRSERAFRIRAESYKTAFEIMDKINISDIYVSNGNPVIKTYN